MLTGYFVDPYLFNFNFFMKPKNETPSDSGRNVFVIQDAEGKKL